VVEGSNRRFRDALERLHDPHVETPVRVSHVEMRHIETAPRAKITAPTPAVLHMEMAASTEHARADGTESWVLPHVETHVLARHAEMTSTPHVETRVSARHAEMTATPHVETPEMTSTPHVETHMTARHVEITSSRHVEPHVARHVEATSMASAYSTAVMRAEARQALQKLGFKPPISSKCVDAALASRPPPATLEQLIRVALKQSLIGTSTVTLTAPESTSRGHR
jgi:hypothetical protein